MYWETVVFVICLSVVITLIPNKSNFPEIYFVPVIVALMTKYSMGDWDKGYAWTRSDIWYWVSILIVSYITVFFISRYS
jgi:hypothetical protein